MKPHYLYIIARSDDRGPWGPVKIGVTTDIVARLASLQTGSAERLTVQAMFYAGDNEDARRWETEIHDAFRSVRLHGEWFDILAGRALGAVVALMSAEDPGKWIETVAESERRAGIRCACDEDCTLEYRRPDAASLS